ncbi:MAG: hypothetical protein NTV77_03835, partial [Candidatus Azambacteria bacterium]|nr:hypothetical protein [Candidatus Azambacteria bacterium]
MKFINFKNRKVIIISSFLSFFIFAGIISACFFQENIKNITAKQAFKHASYYFNGGAYDLNKAEHWYKIALAIQPKLTNTHYQLARIYFVKGDFDKALTEINTELNSNSDNGRSYYIKGLIDGYSVDNQAAIADFKKFVAWSPKDWAGYNDLAWAQYKAKDFKAAEETISVALKNVVPNAFLLNGLGAAKLGQKKYDEAKKVFASALQLAQNLTIKDWQSAYPGNDPAEAEKNLKKFKDNLASNSGLASEKLSMGGVFAAACSASTYYRCSGTSCVAYTCDPDHESCSNTCSNDYDCGATPLAPTNLSASCPAPGNSATLSWSPVAGATIYAVRVNNLANPWS